MFKKCSRILCDGVRIHKHCILTKGQWSHTTNMLLQLPWAWIHGLVGCSFKFFLCFIFTLFLQPKVFQVISVLLWTVTKSQGRVMCDSLPPSLPLSSNPFRNKLCKHISKAIRYILAQLKDSSTGLLADRQAKRNILQAPNWGNEILLVHSLWTKPDNLSLVLNWHQHATHQTVQLI